MFLSSRYLLPTALSAAWEVWFRYQMVACFPKSQQAKGRSCCRQLQVANGTNSGKGLEAATTAWAAFALCPRVWRTSREPS